MSLSPSGSGSGWAVTWVGICLGAARPHRQDWIRGFANAYFNYDPAVRDWTDDTNELYYMELNITQ